MSIIVHDCPFCGSGFIALTKSVKDIGECWAYCEDCESTGPSAHTEAGALDLWNKRAPEEKEAA